MMGILGFIFACLGKHISLVFPILVSSWFFRNCLPESQAMRNFNHLDFCNDISSKTARIRFIDIQNPSLRFLHRWLYFMLFPMRELCSVTIVELKCLFAMVNKIKYTP
jgi:hypothetical protein